MLFRSLTTKIVAAAAVLVVACADLLPVLGTVVVEATSAEVVLKPPSLDSRRKVRKRRRVEEEAANDAEAEEDEDDSVYNRGYIQPKGCASYTISLSNEDGQRGNQISDPGVYVVGQETFMFFEYLLPVNVTTTNDDDGTADNGDATYDDSTATDDGTNQYQQYYYNDGNNRRNLEENDDNSANQYQQYYYNNGDGSYYHSFGANAILAKDWVVALSNGALNTGCVKLMDDSGVFRDIVPGLEDGRLSFSTLYYGPICASDASNSNDDDESSATTAVFEMGIFLDSSCNAYVPGLSQILNKRLLSDWTTGMSFGSTSNSNTNNSNDDDRGDNEGEGGTKNNSYSYDRYYGNSGDLHDLDSYETIIQQLNDHQKREIFDCETYPEICEQVSETSVDLNTCQTLSSELWEAGANGDDYNYDASNNDDDAVEESANDYGEFVLTSINSENESNEEGQEEEETSEEYRYQMFQQVLEDYAYCSADSNADDDGCTGWNYGWGHYDCITGDDGGYAYNADDDCREGVCYAILESSSKGHSLREWLDAKSEDLENEMALTYMVDITFNAFWHGLVAFCGVILLLLVALACWTEGILRTFSKRQRSRAHQKKKEPFLDHNTEHSSTNSSLGSLDTNPPTVMLELTPTRSSLSRPPQPPPLGKKRKSESVEVVWYRHGQPNQKGSLA